MDVAALALRLAALQQEHAAVEDQIAGLGFRRAMLQGAIMEVKRMLQPVSLSQAAAAVLAETNGNQG